MALDTCDPCACIPPSIDAYAFHQKAVIILCGILAALEAGSTGCDCVTDGQVVDAATTGGLALGTDGTNYQVLSVTSSGALNVGSVIPGTGATNLGKAEDAVAASGDTGVMALAVIQATPAASAADGDYGSLKTDALGKVWGASDQVEDLGHTTGDRGSFILAVRNDSAAAFTTTDLDYSPVAVDSAGRLKLSASTLSLGDIANITTSVTPGTAAANLGKAEDAVAASGDTGVAVLHVIQATPAASAADGDYGFSKLNAVGALFTEPSNQAGTYGATATSGAAGAVPTTGVSVHTNAAKAKIITVSNILDVPVLISLDAGTTYIAYVAVNASIVLDLGASGRWTASNIFAKAVGSNSASGNIYVGTVI